MAEIKYKRVLLKLSGEALSGEKGFGFDPETAKAVAAMTVATALMGTRSVPAFAAGWQKSMDMN